MLFPELLKKHNIEPIGIIQAGVHHFQEKQMFMDLGFKYYFLIEPLKKPFQVMQKKANGLNAHCEQCALSWYNGNAKMYVDDNNYQMSSSLLEPLAHKIVYPGITFDKTETVKVRRLDSLPARAYIYNVLYIDVQGSEYDLIMGAYETLHMIDAIYIEINFFEMYAGCKKYPVITNILEKCGFKNVNIEYDKTGAWGNAFYIKSK